MPDSDAHSKRAFVLGLDGVPWPLIDEFVADGDLPNFRRLREEGAAGPLQSTVPPNTPIAWPSIASGKLADAHGLYEFFQVEPDYSQQPTTSDDVRTSMLWDLLSPSVVGNVPMTYPADDVDGTMVSGMMSPTLDERATHPPSLAEQIRDEIPDYEFGLDWSEYDDRTDEFRENLSALVSARRELLDHLVETRDWRLCFFVFTAPDRLQHLVWDEDVLREHYRMLDDVLGDVLTYCEAHSATLYVVSDHGFGPIDRLVRVNRVLADAGLLVKKSDSGTRGALAQVGITKDRVLSTLESVGITEDDIVETLPDSLVERIARRVPGNSARFDIDYENSQAFFHGLGSVYVNDAARFDEGPVPASDRDRVKDEVYELLDDLRDPATGETVFDVVDGDELFDRDDRSPDLVLEPADGYATGTVLYEEPFADSDSIAASHRREGVIFAWGEEIASGVELDDASVLDVAPTLLHGLGEPIPADADGRPLQSAYADGSVPAETAPKTVAYGSGESTGDGIDRFDDVEDRLRGLGYVE